MSLLRRFWRWLQLVVPFGLLVAHQAAPLPRDAARPVGQPRPLALRAGASCSHGVCDGCSLGPRGLRDDVIPGVAPVPDAPGAAAAQHDAAPIPDAALGDIARAARDDQRGAAPARARALSAAAPPGRARLSPHLAGTRRLRLAAEAHARARRADRMGFFVTSRGLTNEAYYIAPEAGAHRRHATRRLAARASATRRRASGLKTTHRLGRADLLALRHDRHRPARAHRHRPRQQPAGRRPSTCTTPREQGTRIVVVNPFREPALDRYWVPSVAGVGALRHARSWTTSSRCARAATSPS